MFVYKKRYDFPVAFLFMLFVQLLWVSAAPVCAEQIIISTFEYPPFMSSDRTTGKVYGLGIDITRAAFQKAGIVPQFKFYPMKRVVHLFESGKLNASLGTITQFKDMGSQRSTSRVEIFPLSFVFFYFHDKLGRITYNQLADLKSYMIGNVRGSITYSIISGAGLTMDLTHSVEQNIIKFIYGRHDLCVAEEQAGKMLIKNRYPGVYQHVSVVDRPICNVPMTLNLTGKYEHFNIRFREGLKQIKNDGTFVKIAGKYLGNEKAFALQSADLLF